LVVATLQISNNTNGTHCWSFHGNRGYVNATECYAIRTLPVFLFVLTWSERPQIKQALIRCLQSICTVSRGIQLCQMKIHFLSVDEFQIIVNMWENLLVALMALLTATRWLRITTKNTSSKTCKEKLSCLVFRTFSALFWAEVFLLCQLITR
jgi:hypothetical protein